MKFLPIILLFFCLCIIIYYNSNNNYSWLLVWASFWESHKSDTSLHRTPEHMLARTKGTITKHVFYPEGLPNLLVIIAIGVKFHKSKIRRKCILPTFKMSMQTKKVCFLSVCWYNMVCIDQSLFFFLSKGTRRIEKWFCFSTFS